MNKHAEAWQDRTVCVVEDDDGVNPPPVGRRIRVTRSRHQPLSLDEALLVLNDHLGDDVEAAVIRSVEGGAELIVAAQETLRHWQDSPLDSHLIGRQYVERYAGFYIVGSARVDVSCAGAARLLRGKHSPYGIDFELARDIRLEILWRPDAAAPPV